MKKLLISLLVLCTFFLSGGLPAFAQSDVTLPSQSDNAKALDDARQGDVHDVLHTQRVVVNQLWTFTGLLGNVAAMSEQADTQQKLYAGSIMGKVTQGIAYVYQTPPANTQMYLADLGQRAGIVKPAYAQGIGFSGLQPILPLWQAFRNVAYGFLIVVLVAIGFMVLFRMKIDPRTVISIQSALPRVVVTLILITFSYAIAGLFIDLMYLSIFLIITVFRSTPYFNAAPNSFTNALTYYTGGPLANVYGSLYSIGMDSVNSVVNIIGGGLLNAVGTFVGAIVGGLIGAANSGVVPFGGFIGAAAGGALGSGAPNALVSIIVWLAVVFAFLRILIMLLGAYIGIIVSLIFGPLQLMLGAIPNTNVFGSWLKNLIANLAVFPITMALLLLGLLLSAAAFNVGNFWVPPGLTGEGASGAAGIIGLGMALSIPTFVNQIKEALKAKPTIQAGPGPIFAPVGTVGGIGMQALSMQYYLRPLYEAWKNRGLPTK